MKKKWLSIYALMAMILVLTACNTNQNNNNDEPNNDTVDPVEEVEGNENNDEEPENIDADEDSSQDDEIADKDENVNEDVENNDGDDKVVDEDNGALPEATLVESDEQDYSLNVLPNYSLTSEEPGKDSLYLDTDDSVFMRIETVPAEAETYDFLLESMLTNLAASSSEAAEPVKLEDKLPSGQSIENAQTYKVDTEEGAVTGVIFERDGIIVRLTIFDAPSGEYFNDFLLMGETVTKK